MDERARMTPDEFATHIAMKEAARAEKEATRRRKLIELAIARGDEPPIFEECDEEGAEAPPSVIEDGGSERTEGDDERPLLMPITPLTLSTSSTTLTIGDDDVGERESSASITLTIAPDDDDVTLAPTRADDDTEDDEVGERESAAQAHLDSRRTLREDLLDRANPNDNAIHAARRFDARYGFYRNVCGRKIRARIAPSMDAATFNAHLVLPDAIVRAEELTPDFIRIGGVWGTAWLPRHDELGMLALRPVAAGQVIITKRYSAQSSVPLDHDEWPTVDDSERKDEVLHRFHALRALCPEGGITWDVVQLAMAAGVSEFEIDNFMRKYDVDCDGQLNLEEYRAADAELVSKWRYQKTWSLFSLADDDRDGVLNSAELLAELPLSVGNEDVTKWMVRYDKSGAYDVITLADFGALTHAVRRDDIMTIVGAAITMAIFLSYIKTAKGIMAIFSIENINGTPYLKQEVGTKAYTTTHKAAIIVAAIYGVVFVIGVPIAALYILYLNRHRLDHRRIRSTFGFLFEGYRKKMFFWEFVVLLRKVSILAVALFWEDAFLQSIVGLFVLIISIVVHMACWPYEDTFLNIAELASLFSLFTLVGLSVLLWYVRQRSSSLELYELVVTSILFVLYAVLGAVLLGRVLYLELRERSLAIASKVKFTQPLFEQVREFEEFVRWNVSGGTLETSAESSPLDPWTFARPIVVDKDAANAETKVELVQRLWRRNRQRQREAAAAAAARSGDDTNELLPRGGASVVTQNPAMAALSPGVEDGGGGGGDRSEESAVWVDTAI